MSKDACVLLEDGVLAGGPPDANGVVREALLGIAIGPSFSARLVNFGPRRPRMPNRLMLGSYVLSQKVGPSFSGHCRSWFKGYSGNH